MEDYKNKVDYRSIKVGDIQHETTLDNCKTPLYVMNALLKMPLRPHTDDEW